MPMDDYDMYHTTSFAFALDVYANDDIQLFVDNVDLGFSQEQVASMKQLSRDITEKIQCGRDCLKVLDYRTVTCMGLRVAFYIRDAALKYTMCWGLVRVWRGQRPNSGSSAGVDVDLSSRIDFGTDF